MSTLFALLVPLVLFFSSISSRQWNDTGSGTIIFEEAFTIPELLFQVQNNVPPLGQTNADLQADLVDIHNQRLAHMDASGVDFMVLSCAAPCVQGIADPANASAMAALVNNRLAATIANNTARFGAFATLSMHDPAEAAAELNRTVKELGFLGALVNDYQISGPSSNPIFVYYDQPEFDVFWQTVVDLDVPVYFHPRTNPAPVSTDLYAHARFLIAAPQEFAATLSTHILGLCTNGVFDRFPQLKIIVGHLGERIPSDLLRIDEQLQRQVPFGMPMQKNVTFYFQHNIFETTSGNFATKLVQFHADQIGLDRILYSVDYPFVAMEQGEAWLETELPSVLDAAELAALRRGLAIELLGLDRD